MIPASIWTFLYTVTTYIKVVNVLRPHSSTVTVLSRSFEDFDVVSFLFFIGHQSIKFKLFFGYSSLLLFLLDDLFSFWSDVKDSADSHFLIHLFWMSFDDIFICWFGLSSHILVEQKLISDLFSIFLVAFKGSKIPEFDFSPRKIDLALGYFPIRITVKHRHAKLVHYFLGNLFNRFFFIFHLWMKSFRPA